MGNDGFNVREIVPDTALFRALKGYVKHLEDEGETPTVKFFEEDQMWLVKTNDKSRIIYRYDIVKAGLVKELLFVTRPEKVEEISDIIKRADEDPKSQFDGILEETRSGEISIEKVSEYFVKIDSIYRIAGSMAAIGTDDSSSNEDDRPITLRDVKKKISQSELAVERPLEEALADVFKVAETYLQGGDDGIPIYVESALKEELNGILPEKEKFVEAKTEDPLDLVVDVVEEEQLEKPVARAEDSLDAFEITVVEPKVDAAPPVKEETPELKEEEMVPIIEEKIGAFMVYNLAGKEDPEIRMVMASCMSSNLEELCNIYDYDHFIVLGNDFVYDLGARECLVSYEEVSSQPLSKADEERLNKLGEVIDKKSISDEKKKGYKQVMFRSGRKYLQMLDFLENNEGNILIYNSVSDKVKPEEIIKVFPEGNIVVYSVDTQAIEDFVDYAFKGNPVVDAYSLNFNNNRKIHFVGSAARNVFKSLQHFAEGLMLGAGEEAKDAVPTKSEESNIHSLVEYKKRKINEI